MVLADEPGNELETDTPNPARMYDYMLGGSANFAPDRDAVRRVEEVVPQVRQQAQANRAFLRRVVRHLAGQGVRQFLDLGSGIPTVGHVHDIARQSAPDARVVYVDSEPVAALYSRQVLASVPGATVVHDDIRNVQAVLDHPDTRALLDLDQPVAVLAFAVLHFIRDDTEVRDLLAAYRDRTVPGSWLALSHGCADDNPTLLRIQQQYQNTSQPGSVRSRAAITALFDGYRLVDPGVVYVSDWRPDPDSEPDTFPPAVLGGLGHKP